MSRDTTKIYSKDDCGVETTFDRLEANEIINQIPPNSGLLGTEAPECEVFYLQLPNQSVMQHSNASVVLGADYPKGAESGYGGVGGQRCATIDLVVGRAGGARTGRGAEDGTMVKNNMITDAARIYISQKTDVDKNFGFANGSIGSIKGRSAICLKADGLRMIGREGIKIITGRAQGVRGAGSDGETNSIGGVLSQAPKIDLIAGNNTEPKANGIETLQPILLGDNTLDALEELEEMLSEIITGIETLGKIERNLYEALAKSFYAFSPYGEPIGDALMQVVEKIDTGCLEPMHEARKNKTLWKLNYFKPYGYKYICSNNVRAT